MVAAPDQMTVVQRGGLQLCLVSAHGAAASWTNKWHGIKYKRLIIVHTCISLLQTYVPSLKSVITV